MHKARGGTGWIGSIVGLEWVVTLTLPTAGDGEFSEQPLQNLVPGTYVVTASPVRQLGATVDTHFDGTGVTMTVGAGATAEVAVNFAPACPSTPPLPACR